MTELIVLAKVLYSVDTMILESDNVLVIEL